MLGGLRYEPDGSLVDDTGHSWRRVSDWVEPAEAHKLIERGTRSVVQWCLTQPEPLRAERFKSDIKVHLLTRAAAGEPEGRSTVPTVMVAELWRSRRNGDLLLFVEHRPFRRSSDELENDW